MKLDAETRLVQVLEKFNQLVDRYALLEDRISDIEAGCDTKNSETFTNAVIKVVESYNESNEIQCMDNIKDEMRDEISDGDASYMSDNLSSEITAALEYEEYCTSDAAYEIAREAIGEYQPEEQDFLNEAESFFRTLVTGAPNCWQQAFHRIANHLTSAKEQKTRKAEEASEDKYFMHKAIQILEAGDATESFTEICIRLRKEKAERLEAEAKAKKEAEESAEIKEQIEVEEVN